MLIDIKLSFVETTSLFIKNIKIYGGDYYQWYVGISIDPKHSFLNIHEVDMLEKSWIISSECPIDFAKYLKNFLITIGCLNNIELDLYEPGHNPRVYLYRMK
ncbi:MAG: hypothetical protein GY714_13665 [Desulfobacterales bacterium]|nr:hypothetical protein [Desulfobacterales bacterium]MCP4162194.1 hypothetical protein [Deltaproteobacteria bacterium]